VRSVTPSSTLRSLVTRAAFMGSLVPCVCFNGASLILGHLISDAIVAALAHLWKNVFSNTGMETIPI
jgi:hypothetical protein